MADSPKCIQCLQKGIVAQTYRVAGKQAYKCHFCKKHNVGPFNAVEFLWKTDKKAWEAWAKSNGFKLESFK